MIIVVNGKERAISATTLAGMLVELGLAETRIATAHGGAFVPRAARESCVLQEGDKVEILAPMQGG